MTTATKTSLLEAAERIGKEHADAYWEEFGEAITQETAGDWDSTSLTEAWIQATRMIDEGRHEEYTEFRLVYLKALYGFEVAPCAQQTAPRPPNRGETMTTATKTTVREFLNRHGTRGLHFEGELSLDLVSFWEPINSNYLRLVEQPDGRIDLTDCNCGDTGADFSDDDISVLRTQVTDWMAVVYQGCDPEDFNTPEFFPLD